MIQLSEEAVSDLITINEPTLSNYERCLAAMGRTPEWFHLTERNWQLRGQDPGSKFVAQYELDNEGTYTLEADTIEGMLVQIKNRARTEYEIREMFKEEMESRLAESNSFFGDDDQW